MKKLSELIYKEFQKVTKESFHSWNYQDEVKYPYLTYDFDSESIEKNIEGFYIDVSIFDKSTSYKNIFTVEESLKEQFNNLKIMTEDLFVRFSYIRSNKSGLAGEKIKRRDIQLYCKVDWRKK